MNIGKTLLTIEAKHGEEVRVLYRDRSDEPPPPIWQGTIGESGKVTIEVPQAYIVIIGSSGGVAVLSLHQTKPAAQTVRL